MIKLKMKRVKKIRFDSVGYRRDLFEAMKKLWREAAGEFVEAIVYTGLVHIDTGMSAASTVPLATEARRGSAIQSFVSSNSKGPKKGMYDLGGTWLRERYRSMRAGRAAGERAYKITLGSLYNMQMTFRFDIKVYQWKYNENMWQALPYGEKVFKKYVETNLKKNVPNVKKYFVTTIK